MEYYEELLGKIGIFSKVIHINLLIVINSGIAVVFFVRIMEPVKSECFHLISFAHT